MSEDLHEVIIRMPVQWPAGEMAGFVERAVTDAMRARDLTGSAVVVFKEGDRWIMFEDGKGFTEGVEPLVFDRISS